MSDLFANYLEAVDFYKAGVRQYGTMGLPPVFPTVTQRLADAETLFGKLVIENLQKHQSDLRG